jgi:hypothetical protein
MISKTALDKIRKIIEKNYRSLLLSIIGSKAKDSLLSKIYFHNILNDVNSTTAPTSIAEMTAQQKTVPKSGIHDVAIEHLNENFEQLVEKLKASTQAGMEGIIREYNMANRNDSLQNQDRSEAIGKLMMQSSVGGLKTQLRDYFQDGNRDWKRVAVTETANAIGMGAIDRVLTQNKEQDLSEIYVYRIPVVDDALCKFCRSFYLDPDGTPAVYRLSTLLSNGSNYGKKPHDWKPVAVATHPGDRETGIIQLNQGWKILAGGKLEFIGKEAWLSYIEKKVRN